ncbi:sugar phosphate isomerase/epimerase family protein [Evansella cellulosilytica]|uniref:Xylose isomerase domain-containing protein TIM barrel n=1 Tax=Evansella cellulosilytica (strain ATCC 21833 / DSM 2522 / FERM P-1141 / JCM 9156 / N-4) TaxID=649639 RepID=E6TTX2_EVAC2|nr:sugar phosphate isomerase/epimerase family protein [Evansella cellulosilytica]ADU32003.1 Xylose isomerase domain-containing protein TIM barrel [Evansella cellulosilytica DSM 2522]
MLKGLTSAGLGEFKDINSFIKLASRYGFQAIDTDSEAIKCFIESEGTAGAKLFLQEHHIEIVAMNLPVEWRESEEQFRNDLPKLVEAAKSAFDVGCKACTTYILPSTDYHSAQFMAVATRRLRTCAQILHNYGIRLGLEFVGPHHLRTAWKNPFIWDLQQTLDFIEAIGEKNVGLLIDAYHCYTTNLSNESLTKLSADQIVHVHINDAKDIPVHELLDNDRLFPGEGVIDLSGFLRALKAAGYKGAVSQEVLTATAPTEPIEGLLEKSQKAYTTIFKKAGLE